MKLFKYIFICTAVMLAVSCNETEKSMTPEEVVENFCRSVAAGDFSTARTLCDTVSMKNYMDSFQNTMNSLQKEDSCALAIASSILSGAEFEVGKTEKDGENRIVHYTIKADGMTKSKTATVAKEEGEWRVKEITDAI